MLNRIYSHILKRPLLILITYGVVLRLLVLVFYNSITTYPDSNGYIELAEFISNFSLDGYSGARTPGYPLVLALFNGNLYLTAIFQVILGLLSVVLIYDFSKLRTKNTSVSFWTAFIFATFFHVVFFEFAILTETLGLFLLLLIFWLIKRYDIFNIKVAPKYVFILSILLSYLYLTRPMFIYLPIGFSIYFIVKNFRFGIRRFLLKAIVILLLPILSYYFWCSNNQFNNGYFASTYLLGVNLAQTATPFFEKVPDEDNLIRDILIKHRERNPMYKSDKKNPMSVWFAWNELLDKTSLSEPDLSNELGRISLNLFKAHPDLYFNQVFQSWKAFWGTSLFFWRTENIKNLFVQKWTYRIWYSFQQYLLIFVNIIFLIFALKKIINFFKLRVYDIDLLIVAIILSGSIAQALITYGSNSRFCVPFFPLIIYFVCSNFYYLNYKHYLKILKFNKLSKLF